MLKFWKRPETPEPDPAASPDAAPHSSVSEDAAANATVAPRRSWLDRLKTGLAKTGSGISGLFVGARVDEALFEELERETGNVSEKTTPAKASTARNATSDVDSNDEPVRTDEPPSRNEQRSAKPEAG